MFNLPYTHGQKAKDIILEFKWLKANAPPKSNTVNVNGTNEDPDDEWRERAKQFHAKCMAISDMFVRVSETSNRVLLQELFPYIWDVKEIVLLLDTFIKWLGSSKKSRSSFIPEDPEPWLLRGGIAEELERLLPLDGGCDMFTRQAPAVPSASVYTIRPALPTDKDSVYNVCLRTCNDGGDGKELYPQFPHLPGDRYAGAYMRHCPELSFVVEDGDGLCGYVLATANVDEFFNFLTDDFAPSVRTKYTRPDPNDGDLSPEEEAIEFLYNPQRFLPDDVLRTHQSLVSIHLLSRAKVNGIGKRLLAVVLSALKSVGRTGVCCDVRSSNTTAVEFYKELGFTELETDQNITADIVLMGRRL